MTHRLHILWLPALVLAMASPAAATLSQQPTQPEPEEQTPAPVLTKAPTLVELEPAAYPSELLAEALAGEVLLYIDIDASGRVSRVSVVEASHPAFKQPALVAATHFRFTPAEIDGEPAPIRIEYRYVFEPEVPQPDAIAGARRERERGPARLSLRGRVREAGVRTPIAGAVVRIDGRPVAETDEDGAFELRNLPSGTITLKIDTPFHHAYETEEELTDDETLEATYYLVKNAQSPYEVVVRGRVERKEVARIKLSRQEVTKVPGTFGDPVRVIENLPGMGRTPGGLGGALLVHGDRPESTGVFIDGFEIPLLYHFGGLTSVINPELLEEIDFYPSGFRAPYGDATAGVVEIESRNLDCEMWRGVADVDFIDASAYTCVPIGRWSVAVAGRRSYVDAFLPTVLDAIPREQDEGRLTATPYYWDYQLKASRAFDKQRLDLFFLGADDRFNLVQSGSAEDLDVSFGLHLAFHRFQVHHTWRPRGDFVLRSSLSPGITLTDFGAEFDELDSRSDLSVNVREINWREEVTWNLHERVTLRAGLDHRFGQATFRINAPINTELRTFPAPVFDFTETRELDHTLDQFNQGYWLECELRPLDQLKLIPGIRFDRWDFHHTQDYSLMPRAAVRWSVTEDTTFKGAYGLYERLPEPQYLIADIGNPSLPPERAHHFVLGVEQALAELVDLDVQAFYNLRSRRPVSSATVRIEDGVVSPEIYTPSGTGDSIGIEILLRQLATPTSRFYGWIAYTLSRTVERNREPGATYEIEKADGTVEVGEYPERSWREYRADFDQTHILTLVGQWRLPWGLEAGLRFRLVTGNPYTPIHRGDVFFDVDADRYRVDISDVPRNSERMPVFHQLDARIDKTWTFDLWRLTAYLELINAYSHRNVEGFQYSYDYDRRVPIELYPILPVLGLKGAF